MADKGKTKIIVRRARASRFRRGISRAGRHARDDADIFGSAVAAYAIGWAEKKGTLASVPRVAGLDPVTSLGVLLYIAQRMKIGGGKWVRSGAIAALSVGAYRSGAGTAVTGDGEEMMG